MGNLDDVRDVLVSLNFPPRVNEDQADARADMERFAERMAATDALIAGLG